ncbi:hypothetical protein [Novosphingobium sp. ST904]|uniref:hypothetical protein n=1 Tax=Novosphingobium sp. ST904 TaxID=1684385 RepID=UPI000AC1D645|nr:hypothetical protein [Novosphingobium sp. ST904]TCM40117.1 hypothetical protein EDF59_105357 [Novosphingobium sp. ST904]
MSYGELIEHAERLHALAASRAGTRADLIQLRDLVPPLVAALREQLDISSDMIEVPQVELTDLVLTVAK